MTLILQGLALGLLFCLTSSNPIVFNYDCTGLPNGFIYWWACGAYGFCNNGVYDQVDCVNGTRYDRRRQDCIPVSDGVSFPCDSPADLCLNYNGPGHRYPETNQDPVDGFPACSFYYTCVNGAYLGHQICNEGLVYDEDEQRCLPSALVPPPCGELDPAERFNRQPFGGGLYSADEVPLVQPQVDSHGNPDRSRWPYTINNRRSGGGAPAPGNRFRNRVTGIPVTNFNPNDFSNSDVLQKK